LTGRGHTAIVKSPCSINICQLLAINVQCELAPLFHAYNIRT